jgi:nuclear pore complex protein Nup88
LKFSNPNVVTNSHLAIAWLDASFPDLLHQSTDTSFLYDSAGKDSILVTTWGSGLLQVDALADEIQPQWNIGGSFSH